MKTVLQALQSQNQRESLRICELPRNHPQAQWQTLQWMEQEVQHLSKAVMRYLGPGHSLEAQKVALDTYPRLRKHNKLIIRAIVRSLSGRELVIRVHCHELDGKGGHYKLARAVYCYRHLKS